MTTQIAQIAQTAHSVEEGNSLPPPLNKSRRWVFTLNNYTDQEFEHLHSSFESKNWLFVVGKEVGASGTPHLQGYFESKNGILFNTVKRLMPRAYIKSAKGNLAQNYKYCTKDGNFITNIDPDLAACKPVKETATEFRRRLVDMVVACEYKDTQWKDWQQEVIDIVNGPVDGRAIHWYWDEKGNIGKSYLAKFLSLDDATIICDGKKDNIFNQVSAMIDNMVIPKIVLLDIPRSLDHINYGAIEQLKNGCIYSGKYEGGKCIFPKPHVICFANVGPDISNMSADRWVVKKLD